MTDRSAVIDIKRGIALFFGPQAEMESRVQSLRTRCKSYGDSAEAEVDKFIRIVSEEEVGAAEYAYMLARNMVPKRLMMRIGVKQ
jgi:hypothetical protein